MKYNQLANTDFSISEIGIGTMSFKGEKNQNQQIIDFALDKGINFLDTADLYQKGDVERMIAQCLGAKRHQIKIASKVGNVWNPDGNSWHWDPSPKHIREGLEQTLIRLKTDYLDLYQLHGGTIDDPWDDILDTLQNLKAEGKIRAFGVSSIRPNVIRRLLLSSEISTLMCQYSILDRRPEEYILPKLKSSPIRMIARGVFAKGILLDKAPKGYLNYSKNEIELINSQLSDFKVSKETLALGYVLSDFSVASAVIGTSHRGQLESTLAGYEAIQTMDEKVLAEIRQKLPINFYDSHR